MKYQLTQAMLDYTLDELASGAQLALTEKQNAEVDFPSKETGSVRIKAGNTVLWLDNQYGELIRAKCSCNEFSGNLYTCRHITALLVEYLLERDGAKSLEKTALEEKLIRKTGIEHPFLPGILRKTDERLRPLAARFRTMPKDPVFSGPVIARKKKQTLSVTCQFDERDNFTVLSLKAGGSKQYIIRNIPLLLEAFEEDKVYSFSAKTQMNAGSEEYDPHSRDVLSFLSRYLKMQERTGRIGPYSFRFSMGEDIMYLKGSELDTLMELLEGKTVQVRQGKTWKNCTVDLSGKTKPLLLSGEEFGATLFVPASRLIGSGFNDFYVQEEERVLRIPAEQYGLWDQISGMSGEEEEIYIEKKDLPAVCTGLLPIIRREGALEAVGMDLEEYLPEMPSFEIRLDYPQENLISCEVFASYGKTGEKYSVFDLNGAGVTRNYPEEQRTREWIASFFGAYEEESHTLYLECDENGLYVFLTEVIPVLSGIGEVMISDNMKKLSVRPAGNISAGVQVEKGMLLVSLHSSWMDRSEIAQVLSGYNRKKKYFRLKNGAFVTISPEESAVWEALSETYRSYGRKNPEAMKVPAFRALYLNEMLEARDEVAFEKGNGYKELLSGLKQEGVKKYQIPQSLKAILRNYQKEGFRWICMLKENGFGGILADDMGLGKTLQVLTFLLSEKEAGKSGDDLRTLIIAPTSLLYNWKKEIEDFTPQLSASVIAGTMDQRKQKIRDAVENADILVTSYELLKRDLASYEGIPFANEIIDEAQYIKNQNTQTAKGVRLLNSSFRLALTGTPIENRLSELWSIFDYLMPGFLYQYSRFRNEFEVPAVSDHDEKVLEKIRRMVHPFILRRLKKDVLKDLPDKIEKTVVVGLEGEQRKLYDAYAERLRQYLENKSDEEFHKGKIEILAELTRLRQICCGPELFLQDYSGENAKKDACLELLREAVEGGHKVLLFSQFTSVLDELCRDLSEQGTSWYRIDGSVSKEERMKQVNAFAKDEVPVFCISLKAGGTGLNLTAADIVIHYDPWWNVAAQNQATDRTHRIGQQNTVTVYQLIAGETIEQQIVALQQKKSQLAEDILSGGSVSDIIFDKEELMKLL